MKTRESQTVPHLPSWPLGLLLIGALAVRLPMALRAIPDGLFDDAYITLRYAANLASGLGFVFNPGEHVWGTTTPLFTFLLAAGAKLFGPGALEGSALTLDLLSSLGLIAVSFLLVRHARVEASVAWLWLTAMAFLPSFVVNAVSGMETPLVMLLMVGTLLCVARDRLVLLAFLGGLLLLARIDTGIWLAVLGLHMVFERRLRRFVHTGLCLGVFLLTVGPWFVFARVYFGSIIPQSVAGKAVSHGSFQALDSAYILSFFSAYFPVTRFESFAWVVLVAVLALVGLGAIHIWSRYRDLRPLVTFFVAYNAFFLLSKAPLFSWYFPPAEWAFYLLAFCGVREILGRVPVLSNKSVTPRLAFSILGIAIALFGCWRGLSSMRNPQRVVWVEIAAFIEQHSNPDARIFLEHIGLVGFKTNRYIYDSMGLVTPATVAIKRAHRESWLPEATREFNADVVLYYRRDAPDFSVSAPTISWIAQNYSRVATFHSSDPIVDVYFLNASPRLRSLPESAAAAPVK